MWGIKSCWDPLRWDEGLGDGVEDVAIVDEVVVGTGCCCCWRIFFGVTSLVDVLAFWYDAPLPRAWARDRKVHPFEAMRGKAVIKPSTSESLISCSRVTRPGLFGRLVRSPPRLLDTCCALLLVQSPVLVKKYIIWSIPDHWRRKTDLLAIPNHGFESEDLPGNSPNSWISVAIGWAPKPRDPSTSRVMNRLHCPTQLEMVFNYIAELYWNAEPTSPSTFTLLNVVICGWDHVWTAMSSPLLKASKNGVGLANILEPIMKWVVVKFWVCRNWTSFVVCCAANHQNL